ncbi:MAG: hypothetical protein ONB44_07675 [candidate division KSB1 bacterium]|nr:hypothetical protein [candidate division KSB1 bacterium]MDZ7302006.1 hypothetical protein [candidate division KSB1 bacterium]MDZ7310188.1 hypothetical protein [candidate division KSB1 bacterium]
MSNSDLVESARLRGVLEGFNPNGQRVLPSEFEELFKTLNNELTENYTREKEEISKEIDALQKDVNELQCAKEDAAKLAELWRNRWGTPIVANYLLWVGFLNVLYFPRFKELFNDKTGKSLVEILPELIQLIQTQARILIAKPWYEQVLLLIPVILLIGAHVLQTFRELSNKSKLSIYVKLTPKWATILFSTQALFIIYENPDNALGVWAAILSLPSCILLALIFKKTDLFERITKSGLLKRMSSKFVGYALWALGILLFTFFLLFSFFPICGNFLLRGLLYFFTIGAIGGLAFGFILKGIYIDAFIKELKATRRLQDLCDRQKEFIIQREDSYRVRKQEFHQRYTEVSNAFFIAFDCARQLSK